MLTTLNLKVGSILHDMEQNIDHRVIYMNKDYKCQLKNVQF